MKSQRILNMEGILQKGISIESILHLATENNLFQVIPSSFSPTLVRIQCHKNLQILVRVYGDLLLHLKR